MARKPAPITDLNPPIPPAFVAYCRSSVSGPTLGIDVQRLTIEGYCQRIGAEVSGWYVDRGPAAIELKRLSTKQPQLVLALADARCNNATLIVSRLDRLTRSTAVLASILDDGPALLVAETPTASRFVLQIYAAVAEEYHWQVSRRIRAGHAIAKAKGTKFGLQGRMAGKLMGERAKAFAANIVPIVEEIRKGHPMSGHQVAAELNARGYRTMTGRLWSRATIRLAWLWFHRRWDSRQYPKAPPTGAPRLLAAAKAREEMLRPLIAAYRREGAHSARALADRLNADGLVLVGGGPWKKSTAKRLLQRLKGKKR